jgi:DNA-binding beta-propeller fold protein YncE
VAAVVAGDSNRVRVIDVESGEACGSYVPRLRSGRPVSAQYAVLHPDRRRVLVIARASAYESWFVVGDVQTGETLLEHGLVYPYGEIAISGDGATAVVTDPSRSLIWDSEPTLDVFDLRQMTHVWRLDHNQFKDVPGQVRFLPDDKRVVTTLPAMVGAEPLYIIDVLRREVTHKIYLSRSDTSVGAGPMTGALGVGPRP